MDSFFFVAFKIYLSLYNVQIENYVKYVCKHSLYFISFRQPCRSLDETKQRPQWRSETRAQAGAQDKIEILAFLLC